MNQVSNPYAPPSSEVTGETNEMESFVPKAIYTPFQVRLASFLGGPIAAVYTLHQNFDSLGNSRAKELTLGVGIGFVILLLGITPFLPERFPKQLLPLLYSIGAGAIASSKQLSKEKINESAQFRRRSSGNMTVVILLSLMVFLLIFIPFFLFLEHLGIV